MKLHHLLIFFSFFPSLQLVGQIDYTNCQDAFQILDPIEYCSENAEFNNINIGASGYGQATCWNGNDNDIWFAFTSFATAINIVIDGNGAGNNLNGIQIALYTGNCGGVINELQCETGFDIVNLFETGLIIGQEYYIRVNGISGAIGNFKICTNNYNPPVEPGQDCISGSILCDKSPFVVQAINGAGFDPDEANGTCLGNFGQLSENQSTWYKWTAANNGTLTFTITPLNPSDDLDFVLFEIPDTDDCDKTPIRCMATACAGPTGIDLTSTDLVEDLNCDAGEDGFVRFIEMQAGTSYALMVNNFSNTGIGFSIEWGGTGEFLGPDPEFIIIPSDSLECDEQFVVVNQSTSPMGINITDYSWTFGERAIPLTSNLQNPGPVFYEKFGQKFIVLEVTTDKGCIVTEVLPIYAEPCCEDLEAIGVDLLDANDLLCPGIPDGSFNVGGFGGSPEYEFSVNGSAFTETTDYDELFAGQYQVNIIDIKGCEDSITLNLNEPDPVIANAGPDQSTTLGFTANLDGGYDPPGEIVDIFWFSDPPDPDMSCTDCPNPEVFPPGTTTYYMQVTTSDGCVTLDSVVVRVKLERPIYDPNIFTPNGDGTNDRFTLFTNRAAKQMDILRVYNRWGELVYEGQNLPLNDPSVGWDGNFKGRTVNPGVYGWYAEITFIDDVKVTFSGDVTVMK